MVLWVSGRPDGHRLVELAAPDGLAIPVREWEHPEPTGVVCYLHGQGEHSGPFAAMGDELQRLGFAVYAHDQRGFGLSRAPRGDIERFDHFVIDAMAVVRHARSRYPERPCFLLGFSMGGHVAMRVAARLQRELAGVVALAPGFKLRRLPLRVLLLAVARLLRAPSGPTPWPFAVPVCRNPEHLERAEADEYWVRAYTPRYYLETWRSIRRAFREAPRIRLPVLVLAPEQDYLVDSRAAAAFVRRLGSPDKEFRILPGVYHNVVADPEMPRIAEAIAAWMHLRVGESSRVDSSHAAC